MWVALILFRMQRNQRTRQRWVRLCQRWVPGQALGGCCHGKQPCEQVCFDMWPARARSEPETSAMLQVAQRFKPHVWMNAHSGMEALFMPCAPPPVLHAKPLACVLRRVNQDVGAGMTASV